MRWDNRKKSANVEDQRGRNVGSKSIIGGSLGIILFLVYTFLGGNPGDFLNNTNIVNQDTNVEYVESKEEKEMADFVSVVLADTEVIWSEIFREMGYTYKEPTLILFKDSVNSACGLAGSSTGPFYCPADYKIYIDLSFFNELRDRFQAPGDFAMAYVIAHEVGHHVQTQLGVTEQMNKLRQSLPEKEYNKYSVRFELQADYLAGVWANRVAGKDYLEDGDLEEALNAASAIGDDRIQRQTQGFIVVDSFTHGSSKQRQAWFYRGFQAGNLDNWDTFSNNY